MRTEAFIAWFDFVVGLSLGSFGRLKFVMVELS